LLPEGGVLRQQINHAAQALERCQGIESQRSLVCLGTRRGLGGDQGWGLAEVCAAAMHRLKLLGSLREELGVGRKLPRSGKARKTGCSEGWIWRMGLPPEAWLIPLPSRTILINAYKA
jgi:hypothetical protein